MKIARLTSNPFQEHTYILWDETSRECAIVDPGCYTPQEQKQLTDYISRNNLTVKHLLLTHLHLDHCFGVPFVARTYQVQPEAHRGDEPLLKLMPQQATLFGTPLPDAPLPIGVYRAGGETIYLGSEPIEIIEIPGHSQGSITFYAPQSGFICVGDALFCGSIGRTDLPGGNFEQLITALHTQLSLLPPATVAYPGHGPETTVGEELENNPFL